MTEIESQGNRIAEMMRAKLVEVTERPELSLVRQNLDIIEESLSELKAFSLSYTFKSKSEEILFFREIKPSILSEYYYHKKIFVYLLKNLHTGSPRLRTINRKWMKRIEKYARRHKAFYQYCQSGQNHWDEYYFSRHSSPSQWVEVDTRFTTGFDLILSRLMAYENLKAFLQHQRVKVDSSKEAVSPKLNWTGAKSALIELVYSLQAAEVLNRGQADIKMIATTFEKLFNTSLGNYYRVFQDIRLRKKNPTVFLDQLKESLKQKMEDLER